MSKQRETCFEHSTLPLAGIPRTAFILGMITAFCECVANECKRVAFSPPFYPSDYDSVCIGAERIAAEQKVGLWYEENADIPPDDRVNWFVLYKFSQDLAAYRDLRAQGYNPAWDLDRFYDLLSYGRVWAPGAEAVEPAMREGRSVEDSVGRLLFRAGQWPPPQGKC